MSDPVRAVVFAGDGSYALERFPMPDPPPGGAVLAVEAVGLCASDIAQLHGHKHVPGEASPVVPGHEIVGRVHSLAPDATLGVEVGQRVGVNLVVFHDGLTVYGYTEPLDRRSGLYGGYGEYMEIVAGTHLEPLPHDVDPAELSLFEPLASAISWIDQLHISGGDTVLIQGPGHMGLICLAVAKARGAGTCIVTGTDADAMRLEAASVLGADHTIDVDAEDPIARIAEVTRGRMCQAVIDVADGATSTVQLAIDAASGGGRILLAGLKQGASAAIVSDEIVFKSLTVIGGSGSTPDSMRSAGAMLRDKLLPTADLLGEVFDLDTLDEALATLQRLDGRDAIRVSLRHRH